VQVSSDPEPASSDVEPEQRFTQVRPDPLLHSYRNADRPDAIVAGQTALSNALVASISRPEPQSRSSIAVPVPEQWNPWLPETLAATQDHTVGPEAQRDFVWTMEPVSFHAAQEEVIAPVPSASPATRPSIDYVATDSRIMSDSHKPEDDSVQSSSSSSPASWLLTPLHWPRSLPVPCEFCSQCADQADQPVLLEHL
jgi:hypothetical protein